MKRDLESFISISRAAMGHGNAQATSAPKLEPPVDIRLESVDIVLKSEGNAVVTPKVDGVPDGSFH